MEYPGGGHAGAFMPRDCVLARNAGVGCGHLLRPRGANAATGHDSGAALWGSAEARTLSQPARLTHASNRLAACSHRAGCACRRSEAGQQLLGKINRLRECSRMRDGYLRFRGCQQECPSTCRSMCQC
eukprot:351557-Chlamydomonas_euryale.AAC.22